MNSELTSRQRRDAFLRNDFHQSHGYRPRTPMRHSHLAVIQQHAVHLLDGSIGRVLSLKVDEGVALGAVFIAHHLEQRRTWR